MNVNVKVCCDGKSYEPDVTPCDECMVRIHKTNYRIRELERRVELLFTMTIVSVVVLLIVLVALLLS